MRILQVSFRSPILNEKGLFLNEPIAFKASKPDSPRIYFVESSAAQIPYMSWDYSQDGRIHINTGLWFITKEVQTAMLKSECRGIVIPPTPALEKLFLYLKEEFSRVIEEFDRAIVPHQSLLEVYINRPDVFYAYVIKRKPPDQVPKLRDDIYTALVWYRWNKEGKSLNDRLAEMHANGLGKGLKSGKHLNKRAERLNLPSVTTI